MPFVLGENSKKGPECVCLELVLDTWDPGTGHPRSGGCVDLDSSGLVGGAGGVLAEEGFDDLEDFLLLAAWQFGDGLKDGAHLACGGRGAAGFLLSQQLFEGDPQRLGEGEQHVGSGKLAAALPVAEVGGGLADLPGQFPHGEAGGFAQLAQMG
jgi:hypothetical protein